MQIIFVVRQNNNFLEEIQDSDIIFGTYHRRNSIYLERENELDKFSILPSLDDTSPTMISMLDHFTLLLKDLSIVLEETHKARDTEMTLHILELIVLCKFCVWNPQKYWLKFTPWGNVMPPTALPENVRLSISGLAPILEK